MKKFSTLFAAITFCCFSINSIAQISFTDNPTSGCKPLTVTFTNTTTDTGAYYWYFYFGDGNTFYKEGYSAFTDTTHIYTAIGNYQPYMYVYDASGNGLGYFYGNQISIPGGTYINAPDSACPGDLVSIQNYDNANSWDWNFGDGNTGTGQYANHTYTTLGTYAITLYINTSCGTDTLTKIIKITNTLAASPMSFGHYPDPACSNDQISYYPYGNANSYFWNFGDGDTSTQSNPAHQYSSLGTYPVTLTITNSCGNSASYTDSAHIISNVPFPAYTLNVYPDSSCPNQQINFYAPGGYLQYIWNFGDNSPNDTTANTYISHTYSAYANYNASVTVFSNCGTDTTLSHTVVINSGVGFPAGLSFTNTSPACTGEYIYFNAPYGYATYVWYYGDGNPNDTNSNASIGHQYSSFATYNASVKIYNACGNDTTFYTAVQITNTGVFSGNPYLNVYGTPACPNDNINIYAQPGFYSYVFIYGDGSPVDSSANYYANHQYAAPGNYTVSVKIYNSCGNDTTLFASANIAGNMPFPSGLTFINSSPVCPNENVSLVAPYNFASYIFNYGDGSPQDTTTSYNMYHTYSSLGNYTASVKFYNNCGNDTTIYATVQISNTAPFPNGISVSNNSPACPNDVVNFSAPYGYNSYIWHFGDGTPNDTLSANQGGYYSNHSYNGLGTYTATVKIFNNCGADTTLSCSVNIGNNVLIPSNVYFNTYPDSVCPGDNFNFNTMGGFTSYQWNFGDSTAVVTTANSYNSHSYSASGIYNASVKITNNCGKDSTLHSIVKVAASMPFPNGIYVYANDTNPICPGQGKSFNTNFSSNSSTFQWNFGDGSAQQTTQYNNVYHNFMTQGIHTVSVKIFNGCGNDTTLTTIVKVGYPPFPPITFTVNPDPVCPNQPVSFYTDYGYYNKYVWNFGDGGPVQTTGNNSTTHTYSSFSTDTASVRIFNYCGLDPYQNPNSYKDTIIYKIVNINNSVGFPNGASVSATQGTCSDNFNFYASPNNASYIWNFGDGTIDTSASNYANHEYSSTGTKTVSVKITNYCGKDTTVSITGDVTQLNHGDFGQNINYSVSPTTACPGEIINVSAYSMNYGTIHAAVYDYGDGSAKDSISDNGTGGTGGGFYKQHSYSSAGTYTISLKLYHTCGNDTTLYQTVTIDTSLGFPNGVYGNVYNNYSCLTQTVSAYVSSGYASYEWNFGDSTSAVITPNYYISHDYAAVGTYNASVKITNYCGKDTTLYMTIDKVSYQPFQWMQLDINPTIACPNDFINFYVQNGWQYNSFKWNFGDSTAVVTLNTPYTNHQFADTGTYTVAVTVTNLCGNDSVITNTIHIKGNLGFVNGVYMNNWPNPVCPGQPVSFNASYGSASYVWHFGDGTPDTTGYSNLQHTYSDTGTYHPMVTITNNCGIDTIISTTVNIENNVGFQYLYYQAQTNVCPGQNVSFYGPWGNANYVFDFGDGSANDTIAAPQTNHIYSSAGTYTTALTIFNYCGEDTTLYAYVNIDTNIAFTYAPMLNFWPNPVCPNTEVNFNTEQGHASYVWNFGDGVQASGSSNTFHKYDSIGSYVAKVTITNFCGSDTTVKVTVQVSDTVSTFPIGITINVTPSVSCPGDMIKLYTQNGFSSYSWNFGDGDTLATTSGQAQHIYNASGSYNASVKITNGCGKSTTINKTINVNNNAPIDSSLAINIPNSPACIGDEVFLNVHGGQPTYHYTWNFGDNSTDSTVGIGTTHAYDSLGTYSVIMIATNGCGNSKTVHDTVNINNNALPVLNSQTFGHAGASNLPAGCPGDAILFFFFGTYNNVWDFGDGNTGTATETITGGDGSPMTVIKHIYSNAGNYTAKLTLTNNCGNSVTDSTTASVTGNLLVNGSMFITPPNGTNGYTTCMSITCIASGGASYSWDFGDGDTITSNSPTIDHSYSVAGTYTIKVSITNGCGYSGTYSTVITINGTGGVAATATAVTASCFDGADGSATVNPTSGTAPFTYQWSAQAGSQTSETATGLSSGTYSVMVTDAHGCSSSINASVAQPTDMTISAATVNSSCGNADGSATVTISGGTGSPYSYAWSTGSATATATGLAAGAYTVTITNANNCVKSSTVSVSNGNAATVSVGSTTNVLCSGGSNGSINMNVSGGTTPYTYLWSTGVQTQNIASLPAGTYSLTVTDASTCVSVQSATITQPNPISISTTSTNANCGSHNGSATVTPAGGTSPYTYLWDDNTGNKTTQTVTGLYAGSYDVVVTDANGCKDSTTAAINNANAPVISAVVNNVSCFGLNNGSISQTVTGGTNPYYYNWSNGLNGGSYKNINNLSPTSYTVIITDASGCVSIRNYTVTQPAVLTATATATAASCGNADGSATVTHTGGNTSFTYLWGNNQTTATATGLAAAGYSVTVTDNKGCSANASATVTAPATFASSTSPTDASCNAGNNGSATLIVNGGNSPYVYVWSNSGSTGTISGLIAGTYNVTVTDVNNCTSTGSATVGQPAALSANFTVSDAQCFGNANGSVNTGVSGGASPYTYLWSTGVLTQNIASLPAGTYSVTVTDANNCTLVDSADVAQPAQLTATASSTDMSCNGVCNGTGIAVPSGGTSPYTYSWANGDNSVTADSLCSGTFVVNISDVHNCQATQSVAISEPSALSVSVSSIGTTCGNTDGSSTASATGGTVPYAYLWSNSNTDSAAVALGTGNVIVTVTDANGCIATAGDSIVTYVPGVPVCIVTVDDSNTKNKIVWEKPTVNYIDSFKVYRDFAGTDTYVGGTAYNDLSVFIDSTNGVNPNIQSYKYKILVLDSCGNESMLSTYHKTMHMNPPVLSSGQVILLWDNYEGFGTTNFYYRILRDSTGTGNNFNVIDSVPYGNITYTDIAPPVGNIDYMIEVVHPFGGCLATEKSENHNSSRSNRSGMTNPGSLAASTTSTDATQGNCDGTATVTANGGATPYTYQWDNNAGNQIASTATGLCAGNYNVTVTDNSGNITTSTVTVFTSGSTLSANATATDATSGNCDGTATVTATGGTTPYTYLWDAASGNQTSATATGLCAGTYSVTVTDNSGNTFTTTATVSISGSTLAANATATNATDSASCNGTASVTATGGATPYTYQWNTTPPQTTATATGLCAGNYVVSVTDSAGNTVIANATVGVNGSALSATATATDATDSVSCNGTATVTPTGGASPYTYLWSTTPPQTTATATGLCAGAYSVTVTDNNSNTTTAGATVGVMPGVFEVSLENSVRIYPNPNKGMFTLQVTSHKSQVSNIKIYNVLGEIVYSSSIKNSQSVIDLSKNGAGVYFLQVVNEKGISNQRIVVE